MVLITGGAVGKIYSEIKQPQKRRAIGIGIAPQRPAAAVLVAAMAVGALVLAVCRTSSHDDD